jgi:hypothetical protein
MGIIMSDTQSFLVAVVCILWAAIAGIQVIDWIQGPKVQACTITFSDATGNRHQFVGQGIVYP